MSIRSLAKTPATGRPEARGSRLPYLPGLDGLRALAIIAVLLYHAELRWIPGGFLGVEIFFVVSGYLITSLLLAEWRQQGHIDLKGFWLRRARRLLPAVFVLIVATLALAVIFLPDEVAGLRGDAAAAVGYVTNWYLILNHQSYFETVGRPSLLRHLWSLAVEEQFYLLWPLLFAAGMRFLKRRCMLLAVLTGAAASAALMAMLYQPDVDPSRVYYGTDTRAAGLFIGAALAFVWAPGQLRDKASGWTLDLVGLGALGALVMYCVKMDEFQPFLYQGGLALVALTTAVLIAVAVHPRARLLPALLSWEPLRWIGLRSYGIYLWYWPVFMVTRPQLDVRLDGLPLLFLRLVVTGMLAELSYRFVETPIRTGALGRAWKALREARGIQGQWLGARWGATVAASVAFSILLGMPVVSAQAPAPPSYLSTGAINTFVPESTPVATAATADEASLVSASAIPVSATLTPAPMTPTTQVPITPAATPATEPSLSPLLIPTDLPSGKPQPASTAAATLAPTRAPASANQVTAIGDSVMLGAASQLEQAIPGVQVDAAVGRQAATAIDILRARRAAGQLGAVVVVHVGNNGTFSAKQFDAMMKELADVRRVVFVSVKVPRRWEDTNNIVLAEGVNRYPNAVLVYWCAASDGRPELFWDDGMHLRPEGAQVYANRIAAAIKAS